MPRISICVEIQLCFDETESELEPVRSVILQKLRRKKWNQLPISYKAGISFNEFKTLIKSWDGPKCKCSVWPYIYIYIYIFQIFLYTVLHKRLFVCVCV